MAGELLTRADIERGKKNFDAFDQYLDGSADAKITLPSGKNIKTRAGVEKELNDKFPPTKAGMREVGSEVGNVPIINNNGVAGIGWGGTTSVSVIDTGQMLNKLMRSGIYRAQPENVESLGGATRDYCTILNMRYNDTSFSQISISNSSRPRAFFQTSISDSESGWAELYHDKNVKPYTTTTATSANVVVTATGELQRSTSSKIFKKDIEDISISDYRDALKSVRPVSYRSTDATADRTDWSWYSFIAEELAAIDKRLVQMSPTEFFEDTDEDGKSFINSRELPEGEYAANGINTNGIVALMVHINQQMLVDIETLESDKTQLKTRMTKLEKRLDALEQPATNSAK